MDTILVVDDEKNYLLVMETLLTGAGYEVLTVDSGEEALEQTRRNDLDLIITDMKMPRMSGIELMEQLKQVYADLPVIMMTAYGTVEKAVEAMKKGAFDYILKPFKNEELLLTIRKALELRHLLTENRRLKQDLEQRYRFENIVGNSKVMQSIFAMVEKVAQTRATVLIAGESGTGKELIARAVHHRSPRSNGPFISVNCGALTETLLESELFGHEKGAFTNALAMRKGRFELAEGGTLFLDEVAEMSPALQVKLLRVLQEMEFERVGGNKTIQVDVRVVAASNRELEDGSGGRQFSGGPVLSAQRRAYGDAAAPAAFRRHPAAGGALYAKICRGQQQRRGPAGAGGDENPLALLLAGECPGAGKCDRAGRDPVQQQHHYDRRFTAQRGRSPGNGI